ncbi:unnamed protein product [Ilex paraguariensis]|uniref:Uncharacterized protein n=1 Tax=Ilex paraguariensis TaxID=185542 RepID=A0ABC8UW86_9AQUA
MDMLVMEGEDFMGNVLKDDGGNKEVEFAETVVEGQQAQNLVGVQTGFPIVHEIVNLQENQKELDEVELLDQVEKYQEDSNERRRLLFFASLRKLDDPPSILANHCCPKHAKISALLLFLTQTG